MRAPEAKRIFQAVAKSRSGNEEGDLGGFPLEKKTETESDTEQKIPQRKRLNHFQLALTWLNVPESHDATVTILRFLTFAIIY